MNLEEVWGTRQYPDIEQMKEYFMKEKKEKNDNVENMSKVLNEICMNIDIETIKLLHDTPLTMKQINRIKQNWEKIQKFVDPNDLIKLLIKQCKTIEVKINGEMKLMNLQNIKKYIELLSLK